MVAIIRPKKKNPFHEKYIRGCQVCFALVLIVYAIQRMITYHNDHLTWVKAPINYIERNCPPPLRYPTLQQAQEEEADNNSIANPRICVTTLSDTKKADWFQRMVRARNFDSVVEMSIPNKQSYCDKHDYFFFDESEKSLDTSRPPSWSKIKAIQRLMTEEKNLCEWVFWTDADTLIMNSNKRLESFMPLPNSTIDLIIAPDKDHAWNAGVFLIRNTEWSLNFLNHWWSMAEFVKPKGLSVSGDNDALTHYLQEIKKQNETYFDEHIVAPARCLFNSNAKFVTPAEYERLSVVENLHKWNAYLSKKAYHKGDLLAHVAGIDNKIEPMIMLLEDAV